MTIRKGPRDFLPNRKSKEGRPDRGQDRDATLLHVRISRESKLHHHQLASIDILINYCRVHRYDIARHLLTRQYFGSGELEIAGKFDSYVRTDLDEVFLRTLRCSNCGMTTHWEPLTEPPHERMGVNANMFDPAALAGLPVVQVDGASW